MKFSLGFPADPARSRLAADHDGSRTHLERVLSRYEALNAPNGMMQVELRAEKITARAPREQRQRLFEASRTARISAKKITWLRREADLVVAAAQGQSACTKGCSACCHVAVAVSQTEALLIAKQTGARLNVEIGACEDIVIDLLDPSSAGSLDSARNGQADKWQGQPCPFLSLDGHGKNGTCSIYASRPLSCRYLINLDADNLLCQLVDGVSIDVPHLNRVDAKAQFFLAFKGRALYADIRDWFPEGLVGRSVSAD